ncbi:MAG: hypothetical protein OXP71_10360 [Candidatus Poribacteria bacterium]|nr:hypothetical protein [Candidatus Poribacteria bacterium]
MISKWHVTTIVAIVAIVLVIVLLGTTDNTVTEREIVISPTSSIEEEYEKYINSLVAKTKTVKDFEGLYLNTHTHPHPSPNPPSTSESKNSVNDQAYSLHGQESGDHGFEIETDLVALENEYQSLLNEASPEMAEMMEDIRARVESMSIEEVINTDLVALAKEYADK